jgi:transcriptional regulator with XRE-family HTH domain
MSLSHVARLEAGKREPRLSSIADLAQVLQVDTADLLRGIE